MRSCCDRFYALGGGREAEAVREVDDRLDDEPAIARSFCVPDERLINLYLGEGQLTKLHERRIAGTEIVIARPIPLILKRVSVSISLTKGWVAPSVSFQDEPIRRNVERPAHPFDKIWKVEVLKAQRRC